MYKQAYHWHNTGGACLVDERREWYQKQVRDAHHHRPSHVSKRCSHACCLAIYMEGYVCTCLIKVIRWQEGVYTFTQAWITENDAVSKVLVS